MTATHTSNLFSENKGKHTTTNPPSVTVTLDIPGKPKSPLPNRHFVQETSKIRTFKDFPERAHSQEMDNLERQRVKKSVRPTLNRK